MLKRLLVVTTLAAATAGCSADPTGAARVEPDGFRSFALGQIALYNALGVDPLQADARTLALMVALCGTAGSLTAMVQRDGLQAAEATAAFCSVVAQAAAPAA